MLLLSVALLSIGFLAIVQRMDFQAKRDREEELIHRGVQYSRAVRKYYKKFGRYPTRIEDLENTNNLRFLRKRYTDPLNRDPKTGKENDFKLLHFTDVQMSFNTGQAPGVAVADIASQQAGAPGALNGGGGGTTGPGPTAFGGLQSPQGQAAQNPQAPNQGDTSPPDQGVASDSGTSNSGTPPAPQPLSPTAGPNGAPQVFGGGAIVGVASAIKDKTIREFNKKNHYNQWQFIYDPTTDRGGLLMTPNQPPLQGAAQINGQQQQNGQNGLPGSLGGMSSPGGTNPVGGTNSGQNQQQGIQPNMPPDQ